MGWFSALFRRGGSEDQLLADLETLLLQADVGPSLTETLIASLRALPRDERHHEGFKNALKRELSALIAETPSDFFSTTPLVLLILGVNGVGKTTTIAKLAHHFKPLGRAVLAVAGDTFRAAAVEQLRVWGERVPFDVVSQGEGADPGAVLFDGLAAAKARNKDLILVDTAGRLHTKKPLLDELGKLVRVMDKFDSTLKRRVLLVLDATTGQNGLVQAKIFSETVPIDGAILTKWDGSSKGGMLFSIGRELKLPIAFIGVGEKMDDLKPFDKMEFVGQLFS